MATYSDNDELVPSSRRYPLARRRFPEIPSVSDLDAIAADEDARLRSMDLSAIHGDRMGPAVSGGIAGFFAGAAALGVVHALAPLAIATPIVRAAELRGVDAMVGFGVAYATAAALGSLVGATFAVVTRYLRKWVPLLVWALVFFVSLVMLLLAASSVYGRGFGVSLSGPILAAGAAYAFVVSFSLPIRRRR